MKTDTLCFLLLLLIGAVLTACGPSQAEIDATATKVAADIFATQTAEAPTATPTFTPSPTSTSTPTVTPSPTQTPTITPTPTPQLMAAALTLDDLPAGFEAMPSEVMSEVQNNLPKEWITFGFGHVASSQLVFGYLGPLTTRAEQIAFDRMLPEMTDLSATAYGADTAPETVPGFEDVGESRAAFTFVTKMFGESLRFESILFRRGEIGQYLFVAYPDGDEPAVPLGDLARLIDNRISGLLAGG